VNESISNAATVPYFTIIGKERHRQSHGPCMVAQQVGFCLNEKTEYIVWHQSAIDFSNLMQY
jgi:hypothetical protein